MSSLFYTFLLRIFLYTRYKIYYSKITSNGGLPDLKILGTLDIPQDVRICFVNNSESSTLGIERRCKISVYKNASLQIMGPLGLSNVVIVATKQISIGKNVMIGGGVTIIDSDFHSLDYNDWFTDKDEHNMNSIPVTIGDNVFIGMNSLILKGVHIGNGSIVAAGSVICKSIPPGEIWGGNPAKFISKNTNYNS